MNALGQYVRVHLTGAAGGIALFRTSARRLSDPDARALVAAISEELVDERRRYLRIARAVRASEPRFFSAIARLTAQATRLGPNALWLRHSAVTDLTVLETMCDAVAGKLAGLHALLSVADLYDALDRSELEALLEQAERQHAQLVEAQRNAARAALSGS